MSEFSVPVVTITAVEPIPDADAIELAVVGDYRSVIRKGQYQPGDRAVYLPEQAVLPPELIEKLGLVGKLGGGAKNRIKAIKLRGCLSQGILYDYGPDCPEEGTEMAETLGIVKYEPTLPTHMRGRMANAFGLPLKFDIENFKKYPDVLEDGELVQFTEKVHGTFAGFGVIPGEDREIFFGGDGIVYSKGLGARGIVLENNPENADNLYVAMAGKLNIHERIRYFFPGQRVHVLGEIFGNGVQDLTYGKPEPEFRVFDIWIDGRYLDRMQVTGVAHRLELPTVPVLYRGPFSRKIMYEHTDGKTVVGNNVHIREGIVVVPLRERSHPRFGRVILKSVSGDYLTRKGEVTEFA